ncbi:MAG: hypothetical protein ABIJ15_01045 [bacterium]
MKNKKLRAICFLFTVFCLLPPEASAANLLTDGGFESYGGATYDVWTELGTASSVNLEKTIVRTGGKSCCFKNPTTSYDGRGIESSLRPVSSYVNENCFSISAYFYVANEAGAACDTDLLLKVKWYDIYQAFIGDELLEEHPSSFGSWQKLESSLLIAPPNAYYGRVVISVKETTNNDNDVYVDDVEFSYFEKPSWLKGKIGLNIIHPDTGDNLHVFFPFGGPAGKPAACRILYDVTDDIKTTIDLRVNMYVYDVMGRLVSIIEKEGTFAKNFYYTWDGKDVNQQFLPCGMYIIVLEVADQKTGDIVKKQRVVAIGKKL